jgi:flagellar basal-body rod modification protein FlgD
MANDNTISGANKIPEFAPVDPSKKPANAVEPGDKNTLGSGVVGKDDFLKLLVHQLQNQDPLDPMKSEEFAVQLATFSQLEQLIDINKKLDGLPAEGSTDATGGAAGSSISTMASFLGYDVALKDQTATVKNGEGPKVQLELPEGVRSARIDFVDESGAVVGSKTLDGVTGGKQSYPLTGLDIRNGNYTLKGVAVDPTGRFVDVSPKVMGTVEGFVLDPEPALLVGGNSVKLDDISEVIPKV